VSGAGEPLRFSHKRHATLKIECVYCHAKAISAERAGFPSASRCMTCHRQGGAPALAPETPIVPATPIYVLPDFVIFSHARHKTEQISCATCHGNVWAEDVVKPQLRMKMKACIDCHKTNHATVVCTACHELSQ
jgi:hypothetical protein